MDKTKAKIQELVPEIMELQIGCEVILANGRGGYIYTGIALTDFDFCTIGDKCQGSYIYKKSDLISLGRPITLADVLLAIKKNNIPDSEEQGIKLESDLISLIRGHFGFKGWDLTKTYEDQRQETKDFIGQILGVK